MKLAKVKRKAVTRYNSAFSSGALLGEFGAGHLSGLSRLYASGNVHGVVDCEFGYCDFLMSIGAMTIGESTEAAEH